jgi:hypothetical protein
MPLYALTNLDSRVQFLFCFPMRRADTAGDYIVDLLLTRHAVCDMVKQFACEVVLRRVYDVQSRNITVSHYDSSSRCMVLLDSDPSRKPLPAPQPHFSPSGEMTYLLYDEDSVYDRITADTYEIPIAQIMENIELACEDYTRWDLMESEYAECPSVLGKTLRRF